MVKTLVTIVLLIPGYAASAQLDSFKISMSLVSLDTLKGIENRLDSIEAAAKGRIDSVTLNYHRMTGKILQLSSDYQQKIDSLQKITLSTEKYTKKLDSLNNVRLEIVKQAEDKIQSIKQKATQKISSIPLPPELQTKVSQITRSLDKITMPSLSSGINSSINLEEINASLDQIIRSADLTGIPKLPSTEVFTDLSKNIVNGPDLASGISEQMGSLQQSAGEITNGVGQLNNIDQLAESQAMKLDGVKELQSAMGETPNLVPNDEQAKQQIVQQVQPLAIDHFAGKEEILQVGMDKLAKYKAKYESMPSVSDAKKLLYNDLKNKPFIERIVPGIQFQILSRNGNLMVDLNAYAGYRINSKFTSGLGWNQRVAYAHRSHTFNGHARIFGPRAFSEYMLGKGFFPRIEVEAMNSEVPPFTSAKPIDNRSREWIVSGLIGIKKEYRFFKNVKGTTIIMVNAFHPHGKNLYSEVICMRFGFEFPMKKRLKTTQSR